METREDVLEWLSRLLAFGIKPGLSRMEALLAALQIDPDAVPTIHVAGTNGKGSTVAFLREMGMAEGLQIGTFTSPYIIQFEERIMLNGVPIAEADLVKAATAVKQAMTELEPTIGTVTEFEALTALAFYHFYQVRPDFVIYEVGLGGLYDSTNVLKQPKAAIITSIGHDHQAILGDTLQEIALQKFGIIKRGTSVIAGKLQEELTVPLMAYCGDRAATLKWSQEAIVSYRLNATGTWATYEGIPETRLGLEGHHQVENAANAVICAKKLGWSKTAIRRGLRNAKHPGRFEIISRKPRIILDGAHNPEGITALVERLKEESKPVTLLCSILRDKDRTAMLAQLHNITPDIYETTFDFPRARTIEELQQDGANVTTVEAFFDQLDINRTYVVTGSLYFISEVRHQYTSIFTK
ncbi:bifunctional folylpolyglutamate synthase/dihydrofolate synthase [Exiguobacterium oxidotolerans]|uniref:bifunctional folylpolyglutamate synthase/dihydrofolate synthase n=1 Tax=Exiguobacterium oxidotolerans TaxID=223958 RepID=UPI000494A6B4|nr:folylpolyglutamate synthase/dihydrofolate synthase family protein [Exiguobacterium oxidotolerans]